MTRMLYTLLLVGLCASTSSAGATRDRRDSRALGIATSNVYRPFIIENIFNYYGNNGDGSNNPFNLESALEYPKGSQKYVVFEDGVVWGGFHKGSVQPKIGGSVYRHALQAGKILYSGTETTDPIGDNPSDPAYRVYRVRADITPATSYASVESSLEAEAALINRFAYITAQELYTSYINDCYDWPAKSSANSSGLAPFQDMNGDGVYEPTIDVPGQPGASQTLYYIANDMNNSLTQNLAGCSPIGLEMHRTIWGYNKQGTMGSTVFASTMLINKSGARVDSMFLVQWADPDLGYAHDDLVGCDTVLDLGYVYNGQSVDNVYGSAVPAVGYTLLQGPRVPSSMQDSALFLGSYRHGYHNLGLSAFVMFTQGVTSLGDPRQGSGGNVDWYNLMNGRIASSGLPFTDPTTNQPTKFVAAGDPITGTGWVDGLPFAPPEDRRMCLVTGPFTLATNDTQEIIVATTAAQGTDRLNSVRELKSGSAQLKRFLTGGVIVSIATVDTLYPVHMPVTLKGSAAVYGHVTPALHWFIASKPAGSLTSLAVLSPDRVDITPDTPGVYRIGLAGSAGSTPPDTTIVQLNVTSIQKPVAAFSVLSSVTLGDTVTIDASSTYDPNGLPITYSWSVEGSRGFDIRTPRDSTSGYLSSTSAQQVKFVPFRTSLHTVTLDVSNGSFMTSLVKTFTVKPLASGGISVNRQLPSGTLSIMNPYPQGFGVPGWYGWGAIKEFDGHIWVNDGGLCAEMSFSDLEHPAVLLGVGAVNYDGKQSCLVSSVSSVAYIVHINAYGLMDSQGIISYPFPRVSADTSFKGVIVLPPYLLIPCGKPGLLVFDISYTSYPSLVSQYFDGEAWANTFVDGALLYGIHPATNTVSVVDIASLPSIKPVASVTLAKSYSSITKVGRYFYLIKTNTSTDYLTANSDTIAIYDFSNSSLPVLMGTIGVPKTFNAYNRFNAVGGYGDSVIVSTAEGLYIYDVSDPAVPTVAGKFLTGSYFGSVFMNPTHMLAVNLNRNSGNTWNAEAAYEGLLELHSPFTNVDSRSVQKPPVAFRLDQNYPNPFNPVTLIRYTIPATAGSMPGARNVELRVYDVLGREVAVLVNEKKEPGHYEVVFDGSKLATGMYLYRLQVGSFVETRKLILLR
jgi:hypothetical protein